MTKEVLERFFKKQCTAKEATEVISYFKQYPALLDEYLNKEEWDTIKAEQPETKEFFNDSLIEIIKKQKTNTAVFWIRRTAVAASIMGLFILGYYRLTKSENIHIKPPGVLASNKIILPTIEHKIITNNHKKPNHLILNDGSGIDLSPGSQLHFDAPFQNNKREIYLEGEAYFKVAKDKSKPFTVYAGKLSTTALGTEFRIITKKNSPGNIRVKLFTGKVAIKSTDKNLKGWNKDVYLLPGQQMNYNADKMFVSVEKMNDNKITRKYLLTSLPADSGQLIFKSASLPFVIDKLSQYFNIAIAYDTSQIKAMSFTGVIAKNDSLQNVLKIIAGMNDLIIEQKNIGFSLKKIPK